MNKKTIYYAVGVIIVVALGGWIFARNSQAPSENNNQNQQPSQSQTPKPEEPQNYEGKVLEGTLKISDNLKKGNLLLDTGKQKIYIFTNRDFSQFLDKQVKVYYEGTLDEFVLGEIVEK